MKNAVSQMESFLWYALGTLMCLAIWVLVKKNILPAFVDSIHWLVLGACVVLLAMHAYWKWKEIAANPLYTKLWMVTLGWIFGAWLASRFGTKF
jgi:hypothetical protein